MKKAFLLSIAVLFCISAPLFAVEEREGFYKMVTMPAFTGPTDITVLTVPAGKRFVLLQILGDSWAIESIKIDEEVVLPERLLNTVSVGSRPHNFPDRCFVLEEGQSLILTKTDTTDSSPDSYFSFVGYFYNCDCTSLPLADLDKDCKVNFSDLALMASEWLVDNTA